MEKTANNAPIEVVRRLDRWATGTELADARHVAGELALIYSAAQHVVEAMDRLTTAGLGSREQARALLDVQTWLSQELQPRASTVAPGLEAVIREIYDRLPDSVDDKE